MVPGLNKLHVQVTVIVVAFNSDLLSESKVIGNLLHLLRLLFTLFILAKVLQEVDTKLTAIYIMTKIHSTFINTDNPRLPL